MEDTGKLLMISLSSLFAVIFWLCAMSLIYIYAGYPVLVFLLARTKKPLVITPGELPDVTLIIAAYNEEAVIKAKLENSLALDYPTDKLQILVAADGSDDRTVELVKEFASRGVDLSFQPAREGKSMALNRAMDKANGEIVLFSDANNYYQPDVLTRLVPFFQHSATGGVTGAKHVRTDEDSLGSSEGLYWKYESFIKAQESRWRTCVATTGEIFAVRKSLFTPIPQKIINDDFYILLSIVTRGYRVHYVPEARSMEKVSISAEAERERRARMTAGLYQVIPLVFSPQVLKRPALFWQIMSHKMARPVIPFAMLGMLQANILALLWPAIPTGQPAMDILTLASPYSILFLTLQGLFYFLAYLGSRTKKKGLLGKILYLPTFLVNSNFALMMGFIRFSRNRQQSSWKRVERVE